MAKPLILVTNDDGINAPGIRTLINVMKDVGDIIVVAPDSPQSGMGHAITINSTLQCHKIKIDDGPQIEYSCSGTPADCVHIASRGIMKKIPDIVFSGVNIGSNMGDDVIYSGTVAGAIEGRFLGLPSIAMSLASWECNHFNTAGNIAKILVNQIDKAPISNNTIMNVNIPDIRINEILGIKSTRLGSRHKSAPSIQDSKDPTLYWIGENGKEADNDEGTDFHAISNNYVSVTPLQIDSTKYSEVLKLSNWLENINY